MKELFLILGALLSFGVSAGSCVTEFSEDKLLHEITQGKQIHTPFILGHLIDGKYEPEMKYKELDITSFNKILKIVKFEHNNALTSGAEKLINTYENHNEIIFRGPNSGYYVKYKFMNKKGCWKLTGFSNEST